MHACIGCTTGNGNIPPHMHSRRLFMSGCTCVVALLQQCGKLCFVLPSYHSFHFNHLQSHIISQHGDLTIFFSSKQIGSNCPKAYNRGGKVGRLSKELTNTNHFHIHMFEMPRQRQPPSTPALFTRCSRYWLIEPIRWQRIWRQCIAHSQKHLGSWKWSSLLQQQGVKGYSHCFLQIH